MNKITSEEFWTVVDDGELDNTWKLAVVEGPHRRWLSEAALGRTHDNYLCVMRNAVVGGGLWHMCIADDKWLIVEAVPAHQRMLLPAWRAPAPRVMRTRFVDAPPTPGEFTARITDARFDGEGAFVCDVQVLSTCASQEYGYCEPDVDRGAPDVDRGAPAAPRHAQWDGNTLVENDGTRVTSIGGTVDIEYKGQCLTVYTSTLAALLIRFRPDLVGPPRGAQ